MQKINYVTFLVISQFITSNEPEFLKSKMPKTENNQTNMNKILAKNTYLEFRLLVM